jgi:VWFA-related protein
MHRALPALACAVVALGVALLAQTPPFRASIDVVEVDVIVQDKTGRFVNDLSLDDFELQDNLAPQPIEQLYLATADGSGTVRAAAAPFALSGAPGSTSRVRAARVFVAVFDDTHLTPGGFKRTQAAALSLFKDQFRDGDVGGVVSEGRMANGRLTSDREELLKAVRSVKPNAKANARIFEEREWPRLSAIEAVRIAGEDRAVLDEAVRRACSDDPDQCRLVDASAAVRSKAIRLRQDTTAGSARTLQILNTLLTGLARLEGHKTILLLSEGFIAEQSWPLVQDVVGVAARANARLYTLDARGLDRGMSDRATAVAPGVDDGLSRLLQQMDFGGDSVNSLAADTGGFVVRNTNIFDKAIAQIAADASNYYVLGYRPVMVPDGKFHKISVKVKRPGVVVRARRGYVATPRPVPAPTAAEPPAPPAPPALPAAPAAAGLPAPPVPPALPAPTSPPAPPAFPAPPAPPAPTALPSPATRLRPAAGAHVSDLAAEGTRDADATAGWDAYQRGDLETARTSLSAAAVRPSAHPWVHYALGQASYALARYPEAIAAWEKVRHSAPAFEPVYFDLVDGYMQVKEYDQAIRLLSDAKRRWPRDPEVFNALGVVQTVRGALDDAIKSFQEAAAVGPNETTSYFNLGRAFEMRYARTRRWVQQLRQWVANDGDRKAAIEQYERYLAFGGPYADSAREGLARLKFVPGAKP